PVSGMFHDGLAGGVDNRQGPLPARDVILGLDGPRSRRDEPCCLPGNIPNPPFHPPPRASREWPGALFAISGGGRRLGWKRGPKSGKLRLQLLAQPSFFREVVFRLLGLALGVVLESAVLFTLFLSLLGAATGVFALFLGLLGALVGLLGSAM